jgi:dimethylargininase
MLTYQSILHLHHLKSASKHVTIRCQTTTIGIARHIPNSFLHALSPNNETVSLALSQSQHASYLYALRTQIPVYSMEALESHPDSVFVEDTVVAVGDVAVITRMGHPSRRGECDSIKGLLRGLGLRVIDMRDMGNDDSVDESVLPCCDGGDVLYTGRHLFVGLSERTNKNGFRFLKKVFCEIGRLKKDDVIAVPPVIQGKEVLHLKSAGEWRALC